ncbi:hypothetical protein LPJ81_001084 [Coemansia sp. IMI 209127]|nr:hypothetical protein LPJ81_001084 [Coemansia sp. IMI 209127]
MHHHPQDHLSLSDSAAAAAAAAMASAMAMAPMVPMITMAPMTSMVPMTPMAPMDVATLASPITTATLPAPISIPRLTSLEQTIMAPAIPTSMVPEQPTPSPVHQQQHSELKRSAISISNSKWNAAMINNNGSSSATVGSNGNEATTHARPLIKLAYLNVDQFYALQQLMREHGEDWALLGHVMGIRPADLSKNWEGYSVDTRVTRQWTREEMELLAICRQMGICCRTSAKIIGTKLPLQCRRKTLKPPLDAESRNARSLSLRRAASPNAGSDSEDGDDIGPNEANNWDTGHGPIDESAATTEAPPTRDSSLITNIVEQQVQASGGAVDWALVSQQSGFTIQQCLEQSLYDENKRPWKYTTTAAFDWELAQSMYQFVVQFYPQPTPINFTAVSNFLWISIVDCLHIFDILRGRINWSPNTVETVRTLWAQGWTSELIARQLSPTLSAAAFERQWVRIGRTNSLNHDVNPLIPRSIDDDSVAAIRDIVTDHTARPDCQVGAMLSAAHHALPALDRSTVDQCVLALLSVHPLYDARRTRRAKQPSAQPSASIGDTAAGIFPHEQQQQQQPEVDRRKHEQEDFATRSTPLNNTSHRMLARSNSSSTSNVGHCKRNSGRWTHEETMYLCQYVRMSRAVAIDWASFAESLGTKSAYQCKNKYRSLKRHGTLK